MPEAADHGSSEFEIPECLELQVLGYPNIFSQKRFTLEVHAPKKHIVGLYGLRRDTRWEFMGFEENNLGNVCYRERRTLHAYVPMGGGTPEAEILWQCMSPAGTHRETVCL